MEPNSGFESDAAVEVEDAPILPKRFLVFVAGAPPNKGLLSVAGVTPNNGLLSAAGVAPNNGLLSVAGVAPNNGFVSAAGAPKEKRLLVSVAGTADVPIPLNRFLTSAGFADSGAGVEAAEPNREEVDLVSVLPNKSFGCSVVVAAGAVPKRLVAVDFGAAAPFVAPNKEDTGGLSVEVD